MENISTFIIENQKFLQKKNVKDQTEVITPNVSYEVSNDIEVAVFEISEIDKNDVMTCKFYSWDQLKKVLDKDKYKDVTSHIGGYGSSYTLDDEGTIFVSLA